MKIKPKYMATFQVWTADKDGIVELEEYEQIIPLASIHQDYLNIKVIPALQELYHFKTVTHFKLINYRKI